MVSANTTAGNLLNFVTGVGNASTNVTAAASGSASAPPKPAPAEANNNNNNNNMMMISTNAANNNSNNILATTNAATNNTANNNNNNNNNASNNSRLEAFAWTRAGRQFASHREIYTRSLYRLCLKFTTSEDEDEGKLEPATAYWTLYGRTTTIGNAGPSSPTPDTICRRMDDSMSGPAAGMLSRLTDADGDPAALFALRAGMTTGWQIRGDRGDAAVRVGRAKVFSTSTSAEGGPGREAQILSLDADRWVLCKGASFAAGNSVFTVDDYNEGKQKITIHCSKGPMRGKLIDIHASRCPFVFGRAHEADLCIMDRELSRRHGAILHLSNNKNNSNPGKPRGKGTAASGGGGGVFVLVDLESTVSTIVSNSRSSSGGGGSGSNCFGGWIGCVQRRAHFLPLSVCLH